jgi:hypothetical protein
MSLPQAWIADEDERISLLEILAPGQIQDLRLVAHWKRRGRLFLLARQFSFLPLRLREFHP